MIYLIYLSEVGKGNKQQFKVPAVIAILRSMLIFCPEVGLEFLCQLQASPSSLPPHFCFDVLDAETSPRPRWLVSSQPPCGMCSSRPLHGIAIAIPILCTRPRVPCMPAQRFPPSVSALICLASSMGGQLIPCRLWLAGLSAALRDVLQSPSPCYRDRY